MPTRRSRRTPVPAATPRRPTACPSAPSRCPRLDRKPVTTCGRLSGPPRLLARVALEALPDDVTVQRVQLHHERLAAELFAGDQGRATAAEQIEHALSG